MHPILLLPAQMDFEATASAPVSELKLPQGMRGRNKRLSTWNFHHLTQIEWDRLWPCPVCHRSTHVPVDVTTVVVIFAEYNFHPLDGTVLSRLSIVIGKLKE